METKSNAKNVFLNLGAFVALYTLVVSLINLLFTVINTAYPQITDGYNYMGSQSISWPVATLIIFFPIFILLMWLLEKEYVAFPDSQSAGIHKWLTYITLFVAGITIAADLITVLYYFIDGQELTTGFLLKVLVLLVLAGAIFTYYLSDVRGKLTPKGRMIYRVVALVIILASVIWGFSVLGSPRTQRLLKYDDQKINDLMTIDGGVTNYYSVKGVLPQSFADMDSMNYFTQQIDSQTNKPYEYEKTGALTYNLCAEFNNASPSVTKPNVYMRPLGYQSWIHQAGHFCFNQTINPNLYAKPVPR